jgi:cellulose synthase/poly-beta-1,6-N-acetylglucosamine synthase-like glycosyltransferase
MATLEKSAKPMPNTPDQPSMTSQLTSVSYVMPVLNEEQYLRSAVTSILKQDFEGKVEVILALGPSTDKTNQIARELASEFPVILVANPSGTTSAGLNAAIGKAKHDVVIRVDAHSVLESHYTQLAVQVLNETKAANVGGVMRAVGQSAFQQAVAWAYNSRFGLGGGTFHVGGTAGPSDSVYLGVFRRTALKQLGGFDEKVIRGQDWELNLRLRQAGLVVWFDPRLQVEYHPRSRLSKLAKQFFDTGIWRGQLTRSSPKTANLRYFAPPVLALGSLICLGASFALPNCVLIPVVAYFFAVALIAMTASKLSLQARIGLMLALPTMHYSWGAGFWVGLVTKR